VNETPERRGCGGCLLVLAVLAALLAVLAGRSLLDGRSDQVNSVPESAPPPASRSTDKPSGRRPGVINIDTEQGLRSTRAAGTGILLDASGLVLTNNHVIQGATSIRGTVTDNGRRFTAEVVGYDKSGDIAVIRLRGAARLKPAAFGDSTRIQIGDPVTAVGNQGGKGGDPKVVTGRVTALDQQVTATDQSDGSSERLAAMIETDAPIRPGDSGGPLLNTSGQVIGVNTAASAGFTMKMEGTHRGYAIPSDRALGIARQIQQGRASDTVHIGPTAMLGVQVRSVGTRTPGERTPPPAGTGALIAGVLPGTAAETAGLREGTVIIALNDQHVDSPGTLTNILLRYHPGDTVRLGWVDTGGRRFTTPIRLTEGPPQ
jgi:S1-C subfamily serine protease